MPEDEDAQTRTPVSVIIATTGGEGVHRCVRALRRAAGGVQLQLILVVTGGLSGSLPACDEVVHVERPFCWSRANNSGLAMATRPYVLCLNDDCYFRRAGDLERLVRRLDQYRHLIAVAPGGTGFPGHWEQTTLPSGTGLHETRFTVCGACFLARREAFFSVGLFDERFVDYGCDEMDWFYRARAQGYRWGIDTDIQVDHEGSATYGPRREVELPSSDERFRRIHGVEPLDGDHWNRPRREVSWVIASLNNPGHLARCLGSIVASRHLFPADMEVLLSLGGRTDESAEVAETYNASLPEPLPLRIVRFPEPAPNSGAAKNRALRLALGDVHLPMDDDDAVLPQRARLVHALADGFDVSVGDFWIVGLDGSVERKQSNPVTFERLIQPGAQNWGLWATAIRRDCWARFGMHREDLLTNEDLDLWLRWLRSGAKFIHVPEPVHLYLLRPHSAIFQHDCAQAAEELREQFRAIVAPIASPAVRTEFGEGRSSTTVTGNMVADRPADASPDLFCPNPLSAPFASWQSDPDHRSPVKLICPGLSRTGTRSLAGALSILGFRVIHWAPERLRDVVFGETPEPCFRRYDDVDAILDLPASLFYRELLEAYPGSRVILTVRDEESWFASMCRHYTIIQRSLDPVALDQASQEWTIGYGTSYPNRYVYGKKFREHNEAVLQDCPDALVMDIGGGDGWNKLCPWLGIPTPEVPFPWEGANER